MFQYFFLSILFVYLPGFSSVSFANVANIQKFRKVFFEILNDSILNIFKYIN